MNTLLIGPSKMDFYTDLRLVFRALAGRQSELNWLVTDFECNFYPAPLQSQQLIWIPGQDLTTLVDQYPIQWIWAVLSGFPRAVTLDLAHLDVVPYADGNGALWQPRAAIQHPQAIVELICWDSSATLLLSDDTDLTQRFRGFFPEAVDLDVYSHQRVGE